MDTSLFEFLEGAKNAVIVVGGLTLIYIVARLVFRAYFKGKGEFVQKMKEFGNDEEKE